MNIRLAVEAEAQLLSALAMRAKAHWGYPAEALEGWRAELAVSPQGIRAKPTFVAMVGNEGRLGADALWRYGQLGAPAFQSFGRITPVRLGSHGQRGKEL